MKNVSGPRGITVKQLEQRSGCKIEVRGRGSFKPNPDGKEEPLHVIITVQDTEARAKAKVGARNSRFLAIPRLVLLIAVLCLGADQINSSKLSPASLTYA